MVVMEETTDLLQVIEKLYHTPQHEQGFNNFGSHDIAESEDKHPYNVPNFLNYGIFKIKNIPIFLISS
jgi:hypothetical protein